MANGAISSVFGTAPELAFPIVADGLSSSGSSGNGTPFPPSFDGELANGAMPGLETISASVEPKTIDDPSGSTNGATIDVESYFSFFIRGLLQFPCVELEATSNS